MAASPEQKTHSCWNEKKKKKNKKNHQMECLKTDSSYCNQNSTCAYKLSRFFRLLLLLTSFAFLLLLLLLFFLLSTVECSTRAYNLRLECASMRARANAITCPVYCELHISMDSKIHIRRLARQCLCVRYIRMCNRQIVVVNSAYESFVLGPIATPPIRLLI